MKAFSPGAGEIGGGERRADGAEGVGANIREMRGVGVNIRPVTDSRQKLGRVGA